MLIVFAPVKHFHQTSVLTSSRALFGHPAHASLIFFSINQISLYTVFQRSLDPYYIVTHDTLVLMGT